MTSFPLELTFNAKLDGVAPAASLRVLCCAFVPPRPGLAHSLENEAPIAHDEAPRGVGMMQETTLKNKIGSSRTIMLKKGKHFCMHTAVLSMEHH